jgi:hypothetical protein
MASNCAETAKNGLDSAIVAAAEVFVVVGRGLTVSANSVAMTRTSGLPSTSTRAAYMDPTMTTYNKPAACLHSLFGSVGGTQQQQQKTNNDDQTIVTGVPGLARHSRSNHNNPTTVTVVTPAPMWNLPWIWAETHFPLQYHQDAVVANDNAQSPPFLSAGPGVRAGRPPR